MIDYTEIKRLAEAAKACAHLSYYTSHEGDFQVAASPDVVLKLLTEIDRLRTQNQALREALKDTAQTLAWMQHGKCRGFSDGLLTTQEALDKAREALTAAKQAQPARPINCGTGHCSCIECPYGQAQPERAPNDDTQRLNWLEAQGFPGLGWVARDSTTGRGYRLHQGSTGHVRVRDAIDAAIKQGGQK